MEATLQMFETGVNIEIKFEDDAMNIEFNSPVTWISLSRESALDLAHTILDFYNAVEAKAADGAQDALDST